MTKYFINIVLLFVIIYIIFYLIYCNKESFISNKKLEIFFINLDINKKRHNYIMKQAGTNAHLFRKFNAINGNLINKNNYIKNGIIAKKNRLLKGQLGCLLSHYYLWIKLLKSNKEYSIILEDDVILPDNFVEKTYSILKNLPPNWDILFLGGCNIKGHLVSKNLVKPNTFKGFYNLCLHAYIINKKSILKIIKLCLPFDVPIDNKLREIFPLLNVYYQTPSLIIQNKNIRSTRRDLDGIEQSIFWKYNQENVTIDD